VHKKLNIVDRTHPVLVRAILQKSLYQYVRCLSAKSLTLDPSAEVSTDFSYSNFLLIFNFYLGYQNLDGKGRYLNKLLMFIIQKICHVRLKSNLYLVVKSNSKNYISPKTFFAKHNYFLSTDKIFSWLNSSANFGFRQKNVSYQKLGMVAFWWGGGERSGENRLETSMSEIFSFMKRTVSITIQRFPFVNLCKFYWTDINCNPSARDTLKWFK